MKRKSLPPKVPNQRLKQQREAHGWSQAYVAQVIGTKNFTVGRWERGMSTPSSHFHAKLRTLFQASNEELGLQATRNAAAQPLPSLSVEQDAAEEPAYQPFPIVYDPAIPTLLIHAHGLVGRDQLLERLKTRLLTHQQLALSALKGLPGVGKTALATQIVYDSDILAHFQHGILWAGMGQQPNIMTLLSNWGALLAVAPSEIPTLTSKTAWANTLRDMIGGRFMLIVLDDVWKIEDALALKVGGPNCAYLLTTRFPKLAVQFASEQTEVVYELDENDGVELLARFAPNVIAQEPAAAHMLVRSTGGLPLALTIMGNYLQLQAHSNQPRRIRAALQRLQDVKERLRLTQNAIIASSPQGFTSNMSFSLHAVITLSVQQLSMAAQQALYAIALLAPKPHTFSENAALAVANCDIQTIDALSDAGLLETSVSGRYTLHQTISDYARMESLDTQAERRLVIYSEGFVQERQDDYTTLEQSTTNLLMALQLAEKHSMYEPFVHIILALTPFWEARGLYDLVETHAARGLSYLTESPYVATQARLWLALGRIAERRGVLESALQHYEIGIQLARSIDNKELLSSLLANRGEVALHQGNFEDAIHFAEEGLAIARTIGDDWHTTLLLKILGEASDYLGDIAYGDTLSMEGLTLARKIGDWETACTLLQNLGVNAIKRGDSKLAKSFVQEGLDKAREMEHRQRISALLMIMGVMAMQDEDYKQAMAYYQESLQLARRIGHRVRISYVLQNLGILENVLQHYALSDSYFQQSLAIAREVGHRWLIGETLDEWGEACLSRAEWTRAKALFSEALPITQTISAQELIAHTLFGLGRIYAHEGNFAEASLKGQQALHIFEAESHERMHEVTQWFNTLHKSEGEQTGPLQG